MWKELEETQSKFLVQSELEVKKHNGIVQDEKFLRKVSEQSTYEEALPIWEKLEKILDEKKEIALSAVQIGILKRVAVIKVNGKIFKLLNPIILNKSEERIFKGEGCLSFPGIFKNTIRFGSVEIQDDNLGKFVVDIDSDGILPILLQHEIDHMDGILFFDRMQKPFRCVEKKIGRNAPCPCGSGKKYKKCCGK